MIDLTQDEAFARIRLLRSPNIGPVSYAQLLRRFGKASAALEALPDLAARGGAPYRPGMVTETIPQLKSLSLAKKRRLIAELLDDVFGEQVREPELAGALAARLAHFRRNPDSARNWTEVKARLRGKK